MFESENNSEYFETNGWKVYFEKFGSGPNVILLIPGPIGISKINMIIEIIISYYGIVFIRYWKN